MKKYIVSIIGNKSGAIGIGAMIIFIAMVLVAGIAASVLIQTSTSLQTQVLRTGSQTTSSVATGVLIEGAEGYNTSGAITKLAFEIRPRAGSPDIDLRTTVIEISDSNNKYVLEYDSGNFTLQSAVSADIFGCAFPTTSATEKFGVIVLQDEDNSCTATSPVLNFGDHVVLAVGDVFDGLGPRQDVFGYIIPEEGSPGIIAFHTPESYFEAVMELQ
jgi:archaeal flagellin FlaB